MPKKRRNPLAAFAVSPAGVNFETQNPQEEVKLLLRCHWLTNRGWIIIGLFLFLAPFVFGQIIEQNSFWQKVSSNQQLFLFITYYLTSFFFVFTSFLKWYFAVFLVTNKRVVDVDLIGFLYRNVTEAQLEEIQDVSHTQGGILQIIFNYGNVFVQTAGITQKIEIFKVPRPGYVHDLITDLMIH